MSGAHPDLTWVAPSGAHEILVSDIDGPVVSAASKTPFEASCRVFVIEHVDELGDEAANRMLKTLEEPASFVHLILLTSSWSKCCRRSARAASWCASTRPRSTRSPAEVQATGVDRDTALACARLSLGDAEQARELASEEGRRSAPAPRSSRARPLPGEASGSSPWTEVLAAVRARGEATRAELEARAAAEVELYPRKERKRIETEWTERTRRARRRVETGALDLALQLVSLWFADLACLAWGADELVRNSDRLEELRADSGVDPAALRGAIELVEDTRVRFRSTSPRSWRAKHSRTAWNGCWRCRRTAAACTSARRRNRIARSSSR